MENNGEIPSRPSPSREPFSDVSNAASSSNPLPNAKRRRKSKSTQLQPHPAQNQFLNPSETALVSTSREVASSSIAAPSDLGSVNGDCSFINTSEQTTVYKSTSRRAHITRATSPAALSCPPHRQKSQQNKGKKSKKGVDSVTAHAFSSAPCRRRKKPENFRLPEDFVKKQKEYFASIDKEELMVEEADSE